MPGMHVQSLIWEDRTCCRATKLMSHNYRACAVEPTSWGHWSPCAPQQEKPPQREAHALQLESSPCLWQLEKALVQQWRRRAAKKERKLQVKIITHQQTQEIYNAWKVLGINVCCCQIVVVVSYFQLLYIRPNSSTFLDLSSPFVKWEQESRGFHSITTQGPVAGKVTCSKA